MLRPPTIRLTFALVADAGLEDLLLAVFDALLPQALKVSVRARAAVPSATSFRSGENASPIARSSWSPTAGVFFIAPTANGLQVYMTSPLATSQTYSGLSIDDAYSRKLDVRDSLEDLVKFTGQTIPLLEKFKPKNASDRAAMQDAIDKATQAAADAKQALSIVPKTEKKRKP